MKEAKFNQRIQIYRYENKNPILMLDFKCRDCTEFLSCSHSKHKGANCCIEQEMVASKIFSNIAKINIGKLVKYSVDTKDWMFLNKAQRLVWAIKEEYTK